MVFPASERKGRVIILITEELYGADSQTVGVGPILGLAAFRCPSKTAQIIVELETYSG